MGELCRFPFLQSKIWQKLHIYLEMAIKSGYCLDESRTYNVGCAWLE